MTSLAILINDPICIPRELPRKQKQIPPFHHELIRAIVALLLVTVLQPVISQGDDQIGPYLRGLIRAGVAIESPAPVHMSEGSRHALA
ncbi:hypothetical protein GBA52_000256 [Prunus armeniaca]|nr:hypothetical protein GBA52_000256 [Prunus armeniaca]